MSTSISLDKTDFIKFNVSPRFKAIVAKKAATAGMSLSELGRMLFGAYVHDILTKTPVSQRFLQMAQEAEKEYRQGKGKVFRTPKELSAYFKSLE